MTLLIISIQYILLYRCLTSYLTIRPLFFEYLFYKPTDHSWNPLENIREIVKSQLKGEYVIDNIVMGQTIIEEDKPVDMIVKQNLNIDVKIK